MIILMYPVLASMFFKQLTMFNYVKLAIAKESTNFF